MRVTLVPSTTLASIDIKLARIRKDVKKAANKGILEGGRQLRDFIKYKLLGGQLVKKRSGKLQRGIYLVVENDIVTIKVKGEHADVAEWLDKGINHTWLISARIAPRLVFRVTTGPNSGKIVRAIRVTHPGLYPRHFMREGALEQRSRIKELVELRVREALAVKQLD